MTKQTNTFYVSKNKITGKYFYLSHTPSYSVIENEYYKSIMDADQHETIEAARVHVDAHHPCWCAENYEDDYNGEIEHYKNCQTNFEIKKIKQTLEESDVDE